MIYCLGESLYDIVFSHNQPSWAVAGGGMLNAAVSLGHAGAEVQLITECGNDKIGNLIIDFLRSNNVGTDFINVSENNSSLALAFLDENGNATYQFYKDYSAEAPLFDIPVFNPGDILMFGSLYSIELRNRTNIHHLTSQARRGGATVIYDPNFRPSNAHRINEVIPYIKENIASADIVRASDEDFRIITGHDSHEDIFSFVKDNGAEILILTLNAQGAKLFTNDEIKSFEAVATDVVSTIGAGDSFNAGIAYEIKKLNRKPIDAKDWQIVMSTGLNFAAEVCGLRENYIRKR